MTILSEYDQLREIGRFINYGFGDYVNKCWDCERKYIGAKLSHQCLGCAVKAAKELIEQAEWQSRNLNDRVRIKLTDLGREVVVKNHNALYGDKAHLYPVDMPVPNDDGWCEMQLWEVMREFGEHMSLGGKPVIETEFQFGKRIS